MIRNLFVTALVGAALTAAPAFAAPGHNSGGDSKPPAKIEVARHDPPKHDGGDRDNHHSGEPGNGCDSFSSDLLRRACGHDGPPPGHCESHGRGHEKGRGHGHDDDDECSVSS